MDGIVLSGGVALNARSNTAVQAHFGVPVHVPSAPGDDGVPIGGAWLIQAPTPATPPQHLQYLGMYAKDLNELPYFIKKYKARLINAKDVADLLVRGEV